MRKLGEPEITMKNTKSEILEALNEALARAEQAEKGKLNPEREEGERINKKALDTARKAVEQNIFSRELQDKFNDLEKAIESEESRLQELYGVGREVQKLALVIEAGRERSCAIEREREEKERCARESLEKLTSEYAQAKAEIQAEQDAQAKRLKMERTREEEEYQYDLARARERENNIWADEKAAREAALQKREAQATEMLSQAESKAEYIRTLEEKVETIPSLLSAEREAAIAATTQALKQEQAHQSALAEMERKNAVVRLEDKVSYLEKEIETSNKSVHELQAKLDKAYSEIRDLAAKTVESAGGVKIIGNPEKSSG